jgi:hypothetical protein
MRLILILHRYLGVVVGLVMVLWCLSGFVMIYQGYPRLDAGDRLRGLQPLRFAAAGARALDLADDARLSGFHVEMMGDRPVLRLIQGAGRRRMFDLTDGRAIDGVDAATALNIARTYARGHAIAGRPADVDVIDQDQWTVEGAARRGPVYRVRFGDPAATELYIAARTGEAAQITTRATRLWSYFGAVPHWLYPMVLRSNGKLWDMVVVWVSLAGVFLTVTGGYVGIVRFRRYNGGRWSPYRGWFYWHHIAGLVFGVLVLTWVASGLFTMNPWGFLDTDVGQAERPRLAGSVSGAELKQLLAIAPTLAGGDLVRLEGAPLGGRLFVMATGRDGVSRRLDARGVAASLEAPELRAAMIRMGGPPVVRFMRLDREDAYYYSGYERPVALPVYRADLADRRGSTFYIDARSGRMAAAVDDVGRQSRWLRTGLHDLDFAWLRRRPMWDAVVLLLLAGVTGVCATGAWLAVRRTIRDVRGLIARLGTRGAGAEADRFQGR